MLNGKMHWLARLRGYKGPLVRHIVSFDLADDRVIGGCLAVVLTWFNKEAGLDIWVMKEYDVKESWIKEFTIGSSRPMKFLCLLKNGELLFKYIAGNLVSYNNNNNIPSEIPLGGVWGG
ncbi:hypothetical protein KY284_011362 [Solanum tuberosum]|nr:hypothetical protein KY284_011362 [Solanum tuberosum]